MRKFLCFTTIITTILLIVAMPNLYSKAADMTVTTEGTTTIPVTADVSAVFEVTFPSEITITNYNVKEFEIRGSGSISAYEYLEVSLPSKINLESDTGYYTELNLTQSDTKFTRETMTLDDYGIIHCSIDCGGLSSGFWEGDLEVEISIKNLYYKLPNNYEYFDYIIVAKNKTAKNPDGSDYISIQTSNFPYVYSYANISNSNNSGVFYQNVEYNCETFQYASNMECEHWEIIYCNHDIINAQTGEIWQTRLCP